MKHIVKQLIPKPIKSAMRRVYYSCSDVIESLQRERDDLTPPKRMIYAVGLGDYKEIGEGFLRHFIELCELKPDEKILDVGSGSGRMAAPLTKYLSDEGSYEGFDIMPAEVRWCQKNITPKYPNFHFHLAGVYNKQYNPQGRHKASEYKFPFEDEQFDFIFLTSVFTHLLPPDMENYLSEISRVLKGDGRCLITFFLLNEESLTLVEYGKSSLDFKHDYEVYRIVKDTLPEFAVAYDESFVKNLYEKHGLEIKLPVRYGSWCDRLNSFDYQDIVIASKR